MANMCRECPHRVDQHSQGAGGCLECRCERIPTNDGSVTVDKRAKYAPEVNT